MRRLDRLVALILGVALAGAAALTAIETLLLVLGQPALVVPRTTWARDLSTLRWDDSNLQTVAVIVAVVGVVLLLLQLVPRRRGRLLLRTGPVAGAWLSRTSLNRKVGHDAAQLPQVDKVTVRNGRRRLRVKVQLAPGIAASEGRSLVTSTVNETLGQWPLAEPLHVTVKAATADLPAAPTGGNAHGQSTHAAAPAAGAVATAEPAPEAQEMAGPAPLDEPSPAPSSAAR